MTQRPEKKKDGRTKIDKDFRRVAEEILRRDRELLESLCRFRSMVTEKKRRKDSRQSLVFVLGF